jgi:hypothetical protein
MHVSTTMNCNSQLKIETGIISGSSRITAFTPSGEKGDHNDHTTVTVATVEAINSFVAFLMDSPSS